MSEFDVALIITTLLAPALAVQAQKWIERAQSEKARRIDVFKSLMATRGALTSVKHVEALNMIDLEFPAQKFPDIRDAWRTYLDHLSPPRPILPNSPESAPWEAKTIDLLVRLLSTMAVALKYRFDEVDLRKGAYVPQQHIDDQDQQRQLRLALLRVLDGKAPLQTAIAQLPPVTTRNERD